jgi:hypothetical protein
MNMDMTEIWFEKVGWIHLAQDADQLQTLMNAVMKLWVP